jgi:hypothetical protein
VLTRDLINSDGTVYLIYAEMIAQGEIEKVLAIYPYPFFSFLVAQLSFIFLGDYQLSADIIIALLWMLAGISFVGILKTLGGDERVVLLGCVIFLLFPVINEIRADVYRDAGYIAFGLTSIWMFFLFQINKRSQYILIWSISVLIATLFRIEAVVLIAVPVLLSALNSDKKHIKLILSIVTIFMIVGVFYLIRDCQKDLPFFANRACEAIGNVGDMIDSRVEAVKSEVLNRHSEKYALGYVIFGSLFLLIIPIINNLKLILVYLVLIPSKENSVKLDPGLLSIIGLVVLPLILQVLYGGFLQARYGIFLSILILAALILKFGNIALPKSSMARGFVLFFVVVLFVDGFISMGPSRKYRVEAVEWVKSNISEKYKVISNERSVSYSIMLLHQYQDGWIDNPSCKVISQYDYYVHGSGKREKELPNCVKEDNLIKEFKNKKGHYLRVYRVVDVIDNV